MTTTGASFLTARTRSAPQGFGRPVPRKEDAPPGHRARPLQRRLQPAGPGPRASRPLAARPRAHPVDRCRRRARRAGRARRPHRAGRGGRRARLDPPQAGADQPERVPPRRPRGRARPRHPASAAGRRPRALRGRGGGDGDRGDRRRRRGRGRARPGRLRAAAVGHRHPRRGRARRARPLGASSARTCAWTRSRATRAPPTPPSRRPPTPSGSTPGCRASPACPWSRARPSASTTRATGRYTLYAGSGGVVRHKADLAEVLGVPEAAVRVVAEDVGGNFGTRNSFYPEFALVAWAARRLGRPVKWTCERREAFLTDYQARDLVSAMELALDADGRFLALRGVNTSNVGAHTVTFVPLNKGRELATTVYRVPAAAVRGRAVLSNTSPLSAYRSAGRPQVMFVMERLIDLAARRHGFDRVELRRRNLVPAAAMPYTNPFGIVYDSGDYVAVQDRAVALADWAGFEARRREARGRGRYRGIGLANYIEIATGAPRERAHITVQPEGRIDVVIGTLAAGPGPRDELRPARRRVAGLRARPGAPDQRRHRSRRGGWRLTLGTLDASRRCSHGEGGGPDRGEGRAPRGVAARVGGGRSRVLGRAVPGARHRSRHRPLRGRGRRRAPRRTGGPARAARWSVRRDREHAVLPVRLRGVRGGGGSGDRRGGGRPLHVGGRRRPRHQPADRGRADPRRHRPGPGAGPLGALPLRRGDRPAPVRDLHGVRDAARRSACPRSPPRSARCRPPRTRSACGAAARAARPRRSGRR